MPRNAVEHHKVLLIPVQDGGQRSLQRELLHIELSPQGAEANTLGGAADAQHGYALAGDVAPLPQRFETPLPPVVPGHHAQAGGPAVHGIFLAYVEEFGHGLEISYPPTFDKYQDIVFQIQIDCQFYKPHTPYAT